MVPVIAIEAGIAVVSDFGKRLLPSRGADHALDGRLGTVFLSGALA
jgi:hypothetical protein